MAYSESYDVVIVGSGGAGLTAALFAAKAGLKTLVVEKEDRLGGTLSWSGGGIYLPLTSASREAGFEDDAQSVRTYLHAISDHTVDPVLIDTFIKESPLFFDALRQETDVQLIPIPGMGDWYPDAPGARPGGGRTLMPMAYDAKNLGRDLGRLRKPLGVFNAPGGFMVDLTDIPHLENLKSPASAWRMAKLFGRFLMDRRKYGRGTRVTMGNAVAAGLLKAVLKAGVTAWTKAPAVDLVKNGSRVEGVVIERDGKRVEVEAKRGVLLASGGFSANKEMRQKYIPYADQHYSLMSDSNNGDGIRFGMNAGGHFEKEALETGGWCVISLVPNADGTVTKFPHLVADKPKPGCMAVNAAGQRYANEALLDMVSPMHRSGSVPSWLICDSKFIKKYGLGAVRPGGMGLKKLVKSGYLVERPTVEALAQALGIDPAGLAQTVERNNGFARTGKDLDFGKGDSDADKGFGDRNHKPNPNLGEISTGPFYGLRIYPGDSTTMLGLRVDSDARVLGGDGVPVDGLYAAGLDMYSVFRGRSPGGGANNGPAMLFGYLAARAMSRGVNNPAG